MELLQTRPAERVLVPADAGPALKSPQIYLRLFRPLLPMVEGAYEYMNIVKNPG